MKKRKKQITNITLRKHIRIKRELLLEQDEFKRRIKHLEEIIKALEKDKEYLIRRDHEKSEWARKLLIDWVNH